MGKTLTLKRSFVYLFIAVGIMGILLLVALIQVSRKQAVLAAVNESRFQSYLLADELRQSSDDLTRLARTYVVTADPSYEQQYLDILDIRNGKKPRPQHYERIYWDFVAAGNAKPRPDGETVALQELMKQAGFTEKEFGKLKEAQANSDGLVKTEVIAMNAVKGLFDDGNGHFTKQGPPDQEMARNLMHDKNYHKYKAAIMAPIDEFFVLLDDRTKAAVEAATRASNNAYVISLALLGFLCAGLGVALVLLYRRLHHQLGCEPAYAVDIANQIASGHLAVPIAIEARDRTSLLLSMKAMRDNLANIVGQVRAGTDTIATASNQIASGNLDLSHRTEQQADSLRETASSMEELTATVKQNADNARQANNLASSASDVAGQGGAVVSQVVETMGSINESAKKIVDIISVIDGIAFQTNILALNAAVEAARAGEQGRGFAVVAAEVRNLAQRSAGAAKEIKALISDSVEKVDTGARLVDQAGATMNEVVASVKRVTDIISEITAASHEQTTGIEKINQAIIEMDNVTQQNATLVGEATAAAESLKDQADNLAQVVGVFRVDDSQVNTRAPSKKIEPAVATTKSVAKLETIRQAKRPAPAVKTIRHGAGKPPATSAGGEWEEF